MKKNDTLWVERLNTLIEYIEEFGLIPTDNTEYKDVKIGRWLQNQKSAYRKGELSQDRLNTLNFHLPMWNATLSEWKVMHKNKLIDKYRITHIHGTPISTLYSNPDDLYTCLLRNIYTCEDLWSKYEENMNDQLFDKLPFDPFQCLCAMYSSIVYNSNYLCLLHHLFHGRTRPLSYIVELIESIPVMNSNEMKCKIDNLLDENLSEREKQIIILRFGLDGNKRKTLNECTKLLDTTGPRITGQRVREIESRAIRKLRRVIYQIFKTNTILEKKFDNFSLSRRTIGILYRKGIYTNDELYDFTLTEKISDDMKIDILRFLYLSNKSDDDKQEVISIDDLELSVRAYNCLYRSGVRLIEDITNKTVDDLMKIRNMGRRSLEEILIKLKDLGYELKYDNGESYKFMHYNQ